MIIAAFIVATTQAPDTTDLRAAFRSALVMAVDTILQDEPLVRNAPHVVVDHNSFKALAATHGDRATDWSGLRSVVGTRGVSVETSGCEPLNTCPRIRALSSKRILHGIELTVRVEQIVRLQGGLDLAIHDYVVTLVREGNHFAVQSLRRGPLS